MGWNKVANMPEYWFYDPALGGPSQPPKDAKFFSYVFTTNSWFDHNGNIVTEMRSPELRAYLRSIGKYPSYQNMLCQPSSQDVSSYKRYGHGSTFHHSDHHWEANYNIFLQPVRTACNTRKHDGNTYNRILSEEEKTRERKNFVKNTSKDAVSTVVKSGISMLTHDVSSIGEKLTIAALLMARYKYVEGLLERLKACEDEISKEYPTCEPDKKADLTNQSLLNKNVSNALNTISKILWNKSMDKGLSCIPYVSYGQKAIDLMSSDKELLLTCIKTLADAAFKNNRAAIDFFSTLLALDDIELSSCILNNKDVLIDLLLAVSY